MIIKLAWKHIRTRPISGILTVFASALVLTLLGSFWTLRENLQALQNSPSSPQERYVSIFIKSQAMNQDIKRVLAKIKHEEFIDKAELLSSQSALEEFKKEFGETLTQAVSENIIPHVVKAKLKKGFFERKDFEASIQELRKDESILDIDTGSATRNNEIPQPVEDRLLNWAQVLFFLVFAIVTLLISHLIRLAFESAKTDIETMKVLGTPGWRIFLPLLLEGLFYGMVSALVSLIMLYMCVKSVLPELAMNLLPKNFDVFFLSTSSWMGIIAVALLSSILGALISLPLIARPAKRI